MATPIDYAASDFLGDSVIPRPRTVFTPAAFAESTSIAERARLAQRNLRTSLAFAESESKMRDYILKGQEQDMRAQQLKSQADMFAMQPALRQDLTDLDPTDDDALDRLNEIEPMLTSPQDQRRARIMRSVASNVRRQMSGLLQDMQGILPPEQALQMSRSAMEAYRNGDPDAFDKVRLQLPTYNQAEAERTHLRREAEEPERLVENDFRTAREALVAAGGVPDATKTAADLKTTLSEIKKTLPDLDPDKFLEDPDASLAGLGAAEDSKTRAALTRLEKLAPRAIALRQYRNAEKSRNDFVARKRMFSQDKQVAPGGTPAYITELLSKIKKPQ